MRTYAISTLFLVSILVTGACAGRQVRARSVSAPHIADAALTVAPEPVPAPTPVAEPAPVEGVGTADTIDGPKQASEIAKQLDATDFDVLGSIERDNDKARTAIAVDVRRMTEPRTRVPAPSPYGDTVADAYRIDQSRLGALRRHADLRFDQMWRELETMIAASEAGERATPVAAVVPRTRRSTAPAVEDGGREAAVGSLAFAPSAVSQAPPATAGPSILPAPPGAPPGLTAGPATDRPVPNIFVPDPSAVQQSQLYWSRLLLAALCAAGIGILFGFYAAWRRSRRFRAYSKGSYDHLPDGTVLIQEVVDGDLVTRQMFPPDPLPSRSEPETSEQEAKMDSIERTWHADGDAADDEDDPQAGTPRNRRFDLTDTEDDIVDAHERTDPQPPPVPIAAPDTLVAPDPSSPHVQPESDDAPRLAAGTGKIISCSDDRLEVSGVAHATDPPQEPRSEPVFQEKVIIYEDDSSNAAAMTAATSTPN